MSAKPPPSDDARILLIGDQVEKLRALEAVLAPLNHPVVHATSTAAALRALPRRDFAVILLDVRMARHRGGEVVKQIRSYKRSEHTPIIVLQASPSEEPDFENHSLGVIDYLSEPTQPEVLRAKVRGFVELYLKTQRLLRRERLLRERERRKLELRHHAELGDAQALAAEIVRSTMDAIIAFDADHRVTLFNAAAERMFGHAAAAQGAPIRSLLPTLPVERLGEFCLDALRTAAGGPLTDASLEGERASGERFPVEVSLSCLELSAGRVYTLIVRDISEPRRTEALLLRQARELEQAMLELRELNEVLHERQIELEHAISARSRFYAAMSHELRTPINAIIGYNALLLESIYGPLNERQTHGIERSHSAAGHLLQLVNDVLDLAKIEAGKIELQLEPVDIPGVIEDLFIAVRPMADEEGVTLSVALEGTPSRVVTDPRRVRQILLNLLGNAIRFGEGCPVEVTCAALPEGGVRVEVVDHGTGIDAAEQRKIFDEFIQFDAAGRRQGTGLGLAISRRLARLLNGSLEVESVPGAGSTFRLTLPRTVDDVVVPPQARGANARGAGQSRPAPR